MRDDHESEQARRDRERMLAMMRQAVEAAERVGASIHDARAVIEPDEPAEPLPEEAGAFPAARDEDPSR